MTSQDYRRFLFAFTNNVNFLTKKSNRLRNEFDQESRTLSRLQNDRLAVRDYFDFAATFERKFVHLTRVVLHEDVRVGGCVDRRRWQSNFFREDDVRVVRQNHDRNKEFRIGIDDVEANLIATVYRLLFLINSRSKFDFKQQIFARIDSCLRSASDNRKLDVFGVVKLN